MLENTNFEHYRHVDMWLVDLLKQQKARGFVLYSVLAGYGHRVSMSTAEHGVQKFGGCFLPQSPHGRPMGQEERDNYIFKYSPRGIKEWVQACKSELRRTPQREDVVESVLELELPEADAYPDIGLYTHRFTRPEYLARRQQHATTSTCLSRCRAPSKLTSVGFQSRARRLVLEQTSRNFGK